MNERLAAMLTEIENGGTLHYYAAHAAATELCQSWTDGMRDGTHIFHMVKDVDVVLAILAKFKNDVCNANPTIVNDEPPRAIREFFTTPFEQYREREGQRFTVLRKITQRNATEADRKEYDNEALPMYEIQFSDGFKTAAWPEEVET